MKLTALEVELVATRQVSVQQPGDITIPGRDIRCLPADSNLGYPPADSKTRVSARGAPVIPPAVVLNLIPRLCRTRATRECDLRHVPGRPVSVV
jgi:hypothetical protein